MLQYTAYIYGNLEREELVRSGSVVLHETQRKYYEPQAKNA